MDVSEVADRLAALPTAQQRGFLLDLLQALERRTIDHHAYAAMLQELETDLKQFRAVGRWPGSSYPRRGSQWV